MSCLTPDIRQLLSILLQENRTEFKSSLANFGPLDTNLKTDISEIVSSLSIIEEICLVYSFMFNFCRIVIGTHE